ncbi:MAG: AAA family ATPase [Pseudomonadota bacterium]
MPLIEEVATEEDTGCPSFLIYGTGGGGKSTLMLTCPAPGIVGLDAQANIVKPFLEHGIASYKNGKLVMNTSSVKLWDARRDEKGNGLSDTWAEARRGIDFFIEDSSVKTIIIDNLTFAWEDWVQSERGRSVDSGKTDFAAWDKFLSRCRIMKGRAADAGKLFIFLAHEVETKSGYVKIPIPGQPGEILPADATCVFRIVRKKMAGGKAQRLLMTRPTAEYYAKGYETLLEEEEAADMRVILDKIGLLDNYTQADFEHCKLLEKTFNTPFQSSRLRDLPTGKTVGTNASASAASAASKTKPKASFGITRPTRA